jgi:tetratricopeptide (TPR) repeat protein
MGSSLPLASQTNRWSLIPQVVVMGLLIGVFHLLGTPNKFMCGLLSYLALSNGLRMIIPKAHRHGIALVKENRFAEALPHFINSHQFFTRHKWVDDYRFLTLLSSSNLSYREMALCNAAFCYAQVGNRQKALEFYEQALREYPNSSLAQAGINMLKEV